MGEKERYYEEEEKEEKFEDTMNRQTNCEQLNTHTTTFKYMKYATIIILINNLRVLKLFLTIV